MKFRYSSISAAQECLRKFKLTYVDEVPTESKSGDMAFGTALHLGIKAMFEGEDPQLTFETYWKSIQRDDLNYSRFGWGQLLLQGEIFLRRFEKMHFKKFKPFKIEESFQIEMAGQIVEGTPDFVGWYDGKPGIWDWKTSAARYKHSKLQKNPQLWLYAHAAKKAFGFNAEEVGYKVFVKTEESIQTLQHAVTPEKQASMIADVEMMIRDLSVRKEWPRNPGCFCPHPEICYKGEKLHD